MHSNWGDVMGYGSAHWVIFLLAIGIVLYPVGRILARMGLAPLLSLVLLIPFLNLIALWLVPFVDWPKHGASVHEVEPSGPP